MRFDHGFHLEEGRKWKHQHINHAKSASIQAYSCVEVGVRGWDLPGYRPATVETQ